MRRTRPAFPAPPTDPDDWPGGQSADVQRTRMLTALMAGPITTVEARRHLDILHPAQRVMELRRAGYPIETVWVTQATDAGALHRVGRYILHAATPGARPA